MFQLFGTRLASSQGAYILIAAALMIPTMWLPDVKALSFLGIFALAPPSPSWPRCAFDEFISLSTLRTDQTEL